MRPSTASPTRREAPYQPSQLKAGQTRTLTNFKNEVAPELEPVDRERLEVYISGLVAGDHINVPELVAGLPVEDEVRERFAEVITAALPDQDFEMDSATAVNLLKNKRFAGDNGLRLSVPAQFFGVMVEEQPPGDDGRWTITIHTRDWREK